MVSDSIPNAAIAVASSNPKDFAKKKRANRSARLKQCKLDARREQWLSQVKNKGGRQGEVSGIGSTHGGLTSLERERGMAMEKLEIKASVEVEFYGGGSSRHNDSDSESLPSASPTSHSSSVSGSNFTASSSCSSGRSCSSSSNGSFSGNMSEEDEGGAGDDCRLDDWEAMADALAATDEKKQEHSPGSPDVETRGNSTHYGSQSSIINQALPGNDISNAKQESGGNALRRSLVHSHAWKADDAFRPQSLPNLSKTNFAWGGSTWGHKTALPVPTSCPICYEDLDCTDSSFLPCLCGFRLCLFCHKRILEEDGRCPGCRKQYDCNLVEGEPVMDGGSLTIRLARSSSMITRS